MKMSRFNLQEHARTHYTTTEFPLYSSPHPIAFSPGAAVAVAVRLLWAGLTCRSIRGRFSRLTFLPRELSTNTSAKAADVIKLLRLNKRRVRWYST